MEERSLLDWAKEYHEKGYTVIPIEEGGKKPKVKWQRYQEERPTLDELEEWFKGGRINIGVVTGPPSDLLVLDFDYRHGGDRSILELGLKDCTLDTGGGGKHWYYRYTGSGVNNNMAGVLQGFDIRSRGGYVLAPPSRTAKAYQFRVTTGVNQRQVIPEPKCLPILPDEILKKILFAKPKKDEQQNAIRDKRAGSIMPVRFVPATAGNRNHTAASVAGSIARSCGEYSRGYEALRLWNHAECVPPLSEPELRAVWASIWARASKTSTNNG